MKANGPGRQKLGYVSWKRIFSFLMRANGPGRQKLGCVSKLEEDLKKEEVFNESQRTRKVESRTCK